MTIQAHFGDPCIYCDCPHDEVAVGNCPGRPGLERTADMQLTIDSLLERNGRLHATLSGLLTACEMAVETLDDDSPGPGLSEHQCLVMLRAAIAIGT